MDTEDAAGLDLGGTAAEIREKRRIHVPGIYDRGDRGWRFYQILDQFVASNRSTLTYSAKPLRRNQQVGTGTHGQGRLAPTSMGTRHQRSHDYAGSQRICWRLETLEEVSLDPTVADRFIWKWMASGNYTAVSAYRSFFIGRTTLMGAKELWKASAPPRVKFFLWLALHGRLWTAERRRRHGLQDGDACALCGELPEITDHLLLSCAYAREVWWRALQQIHLQHLVPTLDDNLR